ncbi:hypothetical protein [Pseudomonas oryzihabitans]|uniref:type IV pilus assembly protein FimV n=1 Tax=Pseudomonas oryzihabitans TaxID=47885 RepID=UPI00165E337E
MSGAAQALSLGEIHLNSALNQPFDATIDLSDLRDLGTAELRPNLASVEDFGKAGVDRAFFLNDLKFTPEVRNGRTVIRVTSARPVREPYLNFLLEVNWPSGRILREYTVLLDPPLYTPRLRQRRSRPRCRPRRERAPTRRAHRVRPRRLPRRHRARPRHRAPIPPSGAIPSGKWRRAIARPPASPSTRPCWRSRI